MQDLNYFEKIAQEALFNEEEKKIKEVLGCDSLAIRVKISNKEKFTDTTKVVSFENRE
ncbi:hypothetical protein Lsan_1346 [Legionella santicrucis]|uniref:Uncharacterized protein n=1 Tax=Legionella santicrucis TaxID=45074 RepID=A0A0W0Z2M2_9GAMM|nr:hypothetical protein [Legionella santicrucis]KTD63377.1 hypothetical protein Lsan_1346 [Legionella santicrucis]